MEAFHKAFAPAPERQSPEFRSAVTAPKPVLHHPLPDRLAPASVPASLLKPSLGELDIAANEPAIAPVTEDTANDINNAISKPAA